MKIGIIGRPLGGKSTLFQLLTNHDAGNSQKPNLAVGKIPDRRMEVLTKMHHPRKVTYAAIDFLDVPGFSPGQNASGKLFLDAVRQVDALILVLRAFRSELVPALDEIDPYRDYKEIEQELLWADWSVVETRLERLAKQRAQSQDGARELALLKRCQDALEQGLPLRQMDLAEGDGELLRGYGFLTKKPLVAAVNLDERQILGEPYPGQTKLEEELARLNLPLIKISAQIEQEISELAPEDARDFLSDLGLVESGIERIARTVYAHLGLISYFTAGEQEVHSWTIRKGDTAGRAAGKIHSDLERGFIRAEVVAYDDLVRWGDLQQVKEHGLFRLEGKEYIVQDGDVITFRFNV